MSLFVNCKRLDEDTDNKIKELCFLSLFCILLNILWMLNCEFLRLLSDVICGLNLRLEFHITQCWYWQSSKENCVFTVSIYVVLSVAVPRGDQGVCVLPFFIGYLLFTSEKLTINGK